MITPHQVEALCGKRLVNCRDRAHFEAVFIQEFKRPLELEGFEKKIDGTTEQGFRLKLWVSTGLTVSYNCKTGSWTAWLPKQLADREQAIQEWSDFGGGHWSEEIPTAPGMYATRDLQGHRGRDRRLETVEGVVRDVTVFCPSDKRSEWQGDWWSKPYPALPGAL